ncbi:MAG: helix-turn-helix transcriptional regulator [Clostridia bacterium]|nr:helix-turn-helix transcriptional regulator [Clostridia bacterium]
MNDLKPIIAKNITELRVAAGMTQIELAEKLNYTDKAVSKWERGESVPDVSVLLRVAELFDVKLDYLVREHAKKRTINELAIDKLRNRGLITGISIVLVWLVATVLYVSTDIAAVPPIYRWLVFVWAVPASSIVWLIFNSIWFNKKINYIIISVLVWSALAGTYLTLLVFGIDVFNIWILFFLGIPAQIIILLWSGIKRRKAEQQNEEMV